MGIVLPSLKVEVKGIIVYAWKTEVKGMLVLSFDGSEFNIVEAYNIVVFAFRLLVKEFELGLERLLMLNESGIVVFIFKFVVIGRVVSIFREEVNKIVESFKRGEVVGIFFWIDVIGKVVFISVEMIFWIVEYITGLVYKTSLFSIGFEVTGEVDV